MREPGFWYRPPSWTSRFLMPIGALYGAVAAYRMTRPGKNAGIPVICIGNYHLGGAGKTPATLKIAEILSSSGESPFVVSRGYGGQFIGQVRVDATLHDAREVGDEPLMMASYVPVVVARDRAAGAMLAKQQGASVVLLDDGFQNPSLAKDVSFIVVDSMRGVGNGYVFPAGPLRAALWPQIARTDALIVIGKGHAADDVQSAILANGHPALRASLKPEEKSVASLRGQRVLAFAGIGDPARFFAMLRASGVDVIEERIFADHHSFSSSDMDKLSHIAASKSLLIVTTEKDIMRIRSDAAIARRAGDIVVFKVALDFENEAAVAEFLAAQLSKARHAAI